ncbi:APC family permease [Amphibacillus sp. Q70]|uniref:APC family permease n=1 Tax=Amphibacillus sp. Q70 TaxID=3453416 RepID=UPI003F84E9B8
MGTSIGFYFESLFPNINGQVVAIIAVTIFFIFNLLGVDVMSKLQTILTVILLTTLAAFIIIGIPQVDPIVFNFSHPDFLTDGAGGFMAAIALFVYSTYGQYFVISFSGKAKNPKRNIPLAIIIATAIIFVVYIGIGIVGSGILPISVTAGKPLTVVAEAILPGILFPIFILGGPLLALSSTLNSTYSARAIPILKSVGDGWFPSWIGKTNSKGVPYVIMLFIYLIGVTPIIFDVSISEITSNIVLLTYLLRMITAIAIIRLPKLYPEQWNQSFLHVSNKIFYLFMGLTFITQLYMVYLSVLNLTQIMLVINVTFVIFCVIWAMWRVNTNKVDIQQSISFE